MFALVACEKRAAEGPQPVPTAVTVYVSIDEPFAREVLAEFERRTGIKAVPVFDSEAGKTTGLVNRIIAEHDPLKPAL